MRQNQSKWWFCGSLPFVFLRPGKCSDRLLGPLLRRPLRAAGSHVALWPDKIDSAFSVQLDVLNLSIPSSAHYTVLALSTGAWILGLCSAFYFYGPRTQADPLAKHFPKVYHVFERKFGFDELYLYYVHKIQDRFASLLSFLDIVFLSGFVIRGTASLCAVASLIGRNLHTGNLHAYLYWFLVGIVLLWGLVAGWFVNGISF